MRSSRLWQETRCGTSASCVHSTTSHTQSQACTAPRRAAQRAHGAGHAPVSYAMRGSTSVLTRPVTVSRNMEPTLTRALSTCGWGAAAARAGFQHQRLSVPAAPLCAGHSVQCNHLSVCRRLQQSAQHRHAPQPPRSRPHLAAGAVGTRGQVALVVEPCLLNGKLQKCKATGGGAEEQSAAWAYLQRQASQQAARDAPPNLA